MREFENAGQCARTIMSNDRASRMLGISIEIPRAGEAVATMTVREDMINGFDVIHGGLTFALADTAFAFACNAYDRQAIAASAHIDFLRPARLGDTLRATAREDYRGRRNGYYSVEVRNQGDELVALFHGRSTATGKACVK